MKVVYLVVNRHGFNKLYFFDNKALLLLLLCVVVCLSISHVTRNKKFKFSYFSMFKKKRKSINVPINTRHFSNSFAIISFVLNKYN
jgi:hypothetical protein